MKRSIKWLVFVSLFLIITSSFGMLTVYAKEDKIQVPKVLKDTYVYDQGDFIDEEFEKNTNNFLDELEEKTKIEFVVITIPDLNGYSIEQYANKLANKLGIGKEKEDNGILLLVSKKDNRVRLEIGDGLQGILTDSMCGRILDDYFVPLRKEGNYNQAVFDTVQATLNTLNASDEYDFEITGIDKEKVVDNTTRDVLATVYLVLMIIAIILEVITGSIYGDGFGTGIILGTMRACSGGSSSSGRSSFGGGHFGGGGASR